jgi:uncharacterized protein YjbI with pentapeptide repeats
MKFELLNRYSGVIQVTAEIECADNAPTSIKTGLAVIWAYREGADLMGTDLRRADLTLANLAGANLMGTDLMNANLAGANFTRTNLAGADLMNANLSETNFTGANLTDAYFENANLMGADLTGADLTNVDTIIPNDEIPVVPNIDAAILSEIEAGGILDMYTWHGSPGYWCGTTHCRAGWAIHLAGAKGKELEDKYGAQIAGMLIYIASRPGPAPWFFDTTENALADIRKCAAEQQSEPDRCNVTNKGVSK